MRALDIGVNGKVAWVLGGSSGLGRASALSLSREGAQVAISSRDVDALSEAAAAIESETGGRCIAVPLDVTDSEATAAATRRSASELGPVDILVANAVDLQPEASRIRTTRPCSGPSTSQPLRHGDSSNRWSLR